MEDFSTRTYGTSGLDNRPLFGETSAKVSAGGGLRVGVRLCRLPPSRLGLEWTWKCREAGPAVPPPSWVVCPALVSKSRLEWRKSSESSGQFVGSPSQECGKKPRRGGRFLRGLHNRTLKLCFRCAVSFRPERGPGLLPIIVCLEPLNGSLLRL